jgi:hypothetical protein
VRMMFRAAACAALVLGLAWTSGKPATAGAPQELLPEESAAKARQVLKQVVTTLGGQAYLNVRDMDCEGRVAQYGLSGDLAGLAPFHDEWILPDKNRTEYVAKGDVVFPFMFPVPVPTARGGVLITVFNGTEGWMLDKGGVTNQAEDAIKNFNEQVKFGMNNMLRSRMNEPGMELRYAGPDVVDLKEAEWIEFSDSDHRNFRMAVERSTHLPLRWVVATRDPETRQLTETITSYTQYLAQDGVKTPLSIVRTRNDRKIAQTFLTSCKYNSSLAPDLFTRASLEQRASDVAKKGYKDKGSKSSK